MTRHSRRPAAPSETGQHDTGTVRVVEDAATLKVLSDPTRLAVLTTLMGRSPHDMPVMTVKQLAQELGEPTTKLYRHVKQLEAADLIRIASTRLVSGIQEHSYRACQHQLVFGADMPGGRPPAGSTAPMAPVLDQYYQRFARAADEQQEATAGIPAALLGVVETTVSPAQAADVHERLEALLHTIEDGPAPATDASVHIGVLVGFYARAAND